MPLQNTFTHPLIESSTLKACNVFFFYIFSHETESNSFLKKSTIKRRSGIFYHHQHILKAPYSSKIDSYLSKKGLIN